MITTVLIDDHEILRKGLRTLLEVEDRCRVVGEASDASTGLELVESLRPMVAVVDVQLPDMSGLDVVRRIRQRVSRTAVVMLSMFSDEPLVVDALRAGASGYVLKSSASTDLITAVHAAVAGERYLSESLDADAIDAYTIRLRNGARTLDRFELLTPREREVFQMAAHGLSNPDIADRMGIGVRTVETHRANLMRKLMISSQTDLVRFAIGRGSAQAAHAADGPRALQPEAGDAESP